MTVVDLFAGPGGWDVAAQHLGLDPLGFELDEAACDTRDAAGLQTVRGDLSLLDPLDAAPGPVTGLIASPPCQTFSAAGKGAGRGDLNVLRRAVYHLSVGHPDWQAAASECTDARTALVLEPLRWALALRPEWIACEQVPAVLPVWEMFAITLIGQGYSVWTGILSAEQYGVPQTRKRAILMASKGRVVGPPPPTHQAFTGGPAQHSLCGTLLPWVSMAEALGWGMTARPTPTIAPGKTGDGRVFGSEDRAGALLTAERDEGRWQLVNGNQEQATVRVIDEPASTVAFGHAAASVGFVNTGRDWKPSGEREVGGHGWTDERPATTLAGDPRVPQPGHKKDAATPASPGRMEGAVRISIAEALVLQSFPPDYPIQGSKTKQFQQVGNAIPPLLALHILAALTGDPEVRPTHPRA